MKIEYRMNGVVLEEDVIQSTDFDMISVGSEHCIHLIPEETILLRLLKESNSLGIEFKLVTPKVSQKYMECLLAIIEKLKVSSIPFTIVINDYGLLFECKKRGILPANVIIGRAISRSFEDCLWYEHILRDESEWNRATMLQNNMYDLEKYYYLKKFNITGVECNMLHNQRLSYERLAGMGYLVDVHYKYISVAFSRACQTAKYHKRKPPACDDICKEAFRLKMKHIWTRNVALDSNEESMHQELQRINPVFLLKGNLLLRESLLEIEELKGYPIHSLIFDSSLCRKEEIKKIRSRLEGGRNYEANCNKSTC